MSERIPALEITMNGEKILATPENTTLFAFIGELAVYDHVFIAYEEEESRQIGAYIFKNQVIWDDLVDWMVTNEYPQHVCLRDVAECDVDAFNNTMYPDLRQNASFPQEWVTNGS